MTTRERREEYSSANVVRVLHPTRPLSPNNVSTDFDNNLDYLLDDLQSSVARSKSKDMQYLSPSNTTTVVRERSISPGGGENRKIYKTARYEYSSSTGGDIPQTDVQQKINSLDSLLLDLKHEREQSLDRDKNYSNVGIDSGLLEPNARVSKTTRTYHTTNSTSGSKLNVNRELQYDTAPPAAIVNSSQSTIRQSRSRQRSPTYERNIETKVTRDVSYDSDPTVDNVSTINRTYNYSKNSEPQQVVPFNEIVELDTTNLPDELNGLPMSGNIMPGPGTKVTTTIKTFTYEIPGDTAISTNKSFTYKNEGYNTNTSTNTIYPERDVPPPHHTGGSHTTVYKNQTYNTINRSELNPNYPHDHHREPRSVSPLPPHDPTTIKKSVVYKRETRDTSTSNSYPGQPSNEIHQPQPTYPANAQPHPPGQTTYIYKHDVTNTNTNVHHPPPTGGMPLYPYDPNATLPPHQPGHPAPKQTYLYKHETTNTKNTVYGPPGSRNGPPPHNDYPNSNSLPHPHPQSGYPPNNGYPPTNGPSSNVTYNYSTINTTTRNVHGHPDDRQPLLPPAPFPTDGLETTYVDGAPPKRLDDLLATFHDTNGHGPQYPQRPSNDEPYTPRKEINTALATGKAEPIVDAKVPTKNVAGPPVYYPPGQEMFAKNEQSAAAWRAQGGYAKGSGKYEYEAESKSKSSSKSGAAVVPVCLPLCCAMPCVIM